MVAASMNKKLALLGSLAGLCAIADASRDVAHYAFNGLVVNTLGAVGAGDADTKLFFLGYSEAVLKTEKTEVLTATYNGSTWSGYNKFVVDSQEVAGDRSTFTGGVAFHKNSTLASSVFADAGAVLTVIDGKVSGYGIDASAVATGNTIPEISGLATGVVDVAYISPRVPVGTATGSMVELLLAIDADCSVRVSTLAKTESDGTTSIAASQIGTLTDSSLTSCFSLGATTHDNVVVLYYGNDSTGATTIRPILLTRTTEGGTITLADVSTTRSTFVGEDFALACGVTDQSVIGIALNRELISDDFIPSFTPAFAVTASSTGSPSFALGELLSGTEKKPFTADTDLSAEECGVSFKLDTTASMVEFAFAAGDNDFLSTDVNITFTNDNHENLVLQFTRAATGAGTYKISRAGLTDKLTGASSDYSFAAATATATPKLDFTVIVDNQIAAFTVQDGQHGGVLAISRKNPFNKVCLTNTGATDVTILKETVVTALKESYPNSSVSPRTAAALFGALTLAASAAAILL